MTQDLDGGDVIEIPKYLANEIRRGNVVLFLGAGASLGSTNKLNQSPPLGGQLAELLAAEASISFDSSQDDLSMMAANAQKRLGDARYFQFLKTQYQHCKPSTSLVSLAHYPWHRIYTTNVDDALEGAYRDSPYEVDVLVNNSPVADKPTDASIVQLVKLNGSVDRLESGLIFTPEEYRSNLGSYGKWYEQAALDFLSQPFLFIGTQLNEPIFRHNVDRLMRAKGSRGGTSFIVAPRFSENRRLQFIDENIEPIEGTTGTFTQALSRDLGSHVSVAQMLRERNANVSLLAATLPAAELARLAGELEQLEIISPDALTSRVPPAPTGIRSFYYGSDPQWRDVMDEVPARTDGVVRLVAAIEAGSSRILVHGPAGSGKSTALMVAAYDTARAHPTAFVVWVPRSAEFPIDAIERLSQATNDRFYVFVDDFSIGASALLRVIDRCKNAQFIFAERTNLLPSRSNDYHVEPTVSISLARIADTDIDLLLKRLEQFGPWHRLGKLKPEERRRALQVIANKQLLVGMREATQGIGFDKIAASEYQKLGSEYARLAYAIVALASMHRLDMTVGIFDAAIRHLMPSESVLPDDRLFGLQEIIYQEGKWLRVRHQLLAEFTVSKVVPRRDLLNSVRAILSALAKYEVPLRSSANRSYVRLFAALTNHEFLWRLFRELRSDVLDMFRSFERSFGADGLFWLQYALFEERMGPAYLPLAVNHIRAALRTFPGSFQIINAYANIHFALAVNAASGEEAIALMEQATLSITDERSDELNEAYTAVALAKGRISVVKKWLPERLGEELKAAEERLREVQAKNRGNRRVQEALNYLHLEAARSNGGAATTKRRKRRPSTVRR